MSILVIDDENLQPHLIQSVFLNNAYTTSDRSGNESEDFHVQRVAKARNINEDELRHLFWEYTEPKTA